MDQIVDQMFRGGGAGGDQHRFHAVEPAGIQLRIIVDQIGGLARLRERDRPDAG